MCWNPLDPEQSSFGLELLAEWKEILGETRAGTLGADYNKSNISLSAFPKLGIYLCTDKDCVYTEQYTIQI